MSPIASREIAARMPDAIAVATPGRGEVAGDNRYATCTFRRARRRRRRRWLAAWWTSAYGPGTRLVLLVPPGVEFVKLVFALLRSGATTVLVDPGMGRKHLVNCLAARRAGGVRRGEPRTGRPDGAAAAISARAHSM